MKTYAAMFCAMLAMGALTVSCSSEDEAVQSAAEGEGLISFDVKTETGFQSRAVNEDDYENVGNYTVQLLSNSEVYREWNYKDMPDDLKVPVGTYQLKAFYGEDKAVSEIPYVVGTEDFEVKANAQKITVTCEPTSAKVAVTFDEKMKEFFSDYSVSITTKALTKGQTWEKADSEDVYYLKVDEKEQISMSISLTNNDTKQEFISKKTYELSPGDYKNYKIAPKESESGDGSLSITITFNDKTTDHEIDITIPSDWK